MIMKRGNPALTITILFFALFSSSSSLPSACDAHDKKALLAFKNSFVSTSLSDKWLNSTDCCSWAHVSCDSATGRVTSLNLWNGDEPSPDDVFLNGTIPASIGDLSALEIVIFTNLPAVVGPIPHQLSKLKKLKSLWITKTGVSGPVPSFLSKLTALETLVLEHNKQSGTIPPSLGSLVNLGYLGLAHNQLTGTIPASLFAKLPKGSSAALDLAGNRLTGRIPRSFRDVDFQIVSLEDNKLEGDASVLFGKSKMYTQTIVLARNRLAFDLGKVEFAAGLGYLDISHNRIYGSIPNQITELNMHLLDVSYNKLCGAIPSGGNLPLFDEKYYAHNKCLCGAPLKPCK